MTQSLTATIEAVTARAPAHLDLTDEGQLGAVLEAADRILLHSPEPEVLTALEQRLIASPKPLPLLVHLAVKLARSKILVASIRRHTDISVVFAMYKENLRILPRTPDNPVGEDFLRRKAQQLDWLFKDNPWTSWQLLAVDDGCPEGSGAIAEEIVEEMGAGDSIRVFFLGQAIDEDDPVTRPLTDPGQSRKGGSILYGMAQAARDRTTDHVVLFTDADLSTHLGQSGLLLEPILGDNAHAAIGSRREPTSVVVKHGRRNTRGKLFIYLWKQLLPILGNIVDTQCGFKAFRADIVERIVRESLEKEFAFDIELLVRTELATPGSIVKVPIAWIDSEAASTTTDLEPYLPMLRTTVEIYRHYLTEQRRSEEFANLIESLDEAGWNRLIDRIPTTIADADPTAFSIESPVMASDLLVRIND